MPGYPPADGPTFCVGVEAGWKIFDTPATDRPHEFANPTLSVAGMRVIKAAWGRPGKVGEDDPGRLRNPPGALESLNPLPVRLRAIMQAAFAHGGKRQGEPLSQVLTGLNTATAATGVMEGLPREGPCQFYTIHQIKQGWVLGVIKYGALLARMPEEPWGQHETLLAFEGETVPLAAAFWQSGHHENDPVYAGGLTKDALVRLLGDEDYLSEDTRRQQALRRGQADELFATMMRTNHQLYVQAPRLDWITLRPAFEHQRQEQWRTFCAYVIEENTKEVDADHKVPTL